ncbi:sugar phosphate isomerase/epimerase family protein [Shouchella patagoniensis]|uniref:sugar phosphate isomerase/epimerase family protein n=1 Tax=Shouchella patagoniensis TaxID=228576 RepID=UPI0009954405|nr:TIM barrel protein [Shouchella patagoniensis]
MQIGLSTYAFFWQHNRKSRPLTMLDMIKDTKSYGGEVFQICDYPPLEKATTEELKNIADYADFLEVKLEIGTRGINKEHLLHFKKIAETLRAKVVRTMLHTPDDKPSNAEACERLQSVLPFYKEANIQLSLETYEQVPTRQLIDIVCTLNHSHLGICLDPANTIASLEMPGDVIKNTAPFVNNLHVKDFHFTRHDGWVGFSLTGTSLGKGLLNTDLLMNSLNQKKNKELSAILEFWLPFQGTIEKTIEIEKKWIEESMNYLRRITT